MKLSAIVLTRNEERNIEDCLAGLSWADEILVVDSGSTDHTVALAEKHGAKVLAHPFEDFASQRNFALTQAKGDWVLFIDADERVSSELAKEMMSVSEDLAPLCVYAIPRNNYFFGRRLRFSDSREDAPVRLFPKQHARWSQPVHEMIATDLPVRKLKSPLQHYGTRDLAHYRQKVRDYIPLELKTMREKGVKPALWKFVVVPHAKFLQLYFFKLGILDGITGFQYAILSAYFYTLQKYWLYWKQR